MKGTCLHRLRAVLLGTVILVLAAGVPGEADGQSMRSVTTHEAAREIADNQGRVRLVILFKSGCSISRRAMPEFTSVAAEARRRGVAVLAFNIDRSEARGNEYVRQIGLPVAPKYIVPWERGELDAAFSAVGIRIGRRFTTPLIAVLDESGRVRQWEGGAAVARASRWRAAVGVR